MLMSLLATTPGNRLVMPRSSTAASAGASTGGGALVVAMRHLPGPATPAGGVGMGIQGCTLAGGPGTDDRARGDAIASSDPVVGRAVYSVVLLGRNRDLAGDDLLPCTRPAWS